MKAHEHARSRTQTQSLEISKPALVTRSFAPVLLGLALSLGADSGSAASGSSRWSAEKANEWYSRQPWLAGCNFAPSTAINQLEMWQADTFDLPTIRRELRWAEQLGFNSVRVYLHHLLWNQDQSGFLLRIEQFLQVADSHGIGVMFVLLDGVWDPFPKPGRQPEPKPHVHNSGWVQSPGLDILMDPLRHTELEPYITGIVRHFKDDRRIHAWDIFNEPENPNRSSYGKHEPPNKPELALALLAKAFAWARQAAPSQPLTAGVWIGNWSDPAKLSAVEKLSLEESDVISFHNYSNIEELKQCIENLRRYNRPILCTEFMARPNGSTFDPHLGYMKEQKVGAYCWGFVAGKSQTIYPWNSWTQTYTAEPKVWFHDIFRKDGTPFDPEEIQYIKSLTRPKASR
jgi:hypothetical protein